MDGNQDNMDTCWKAAIVLCCMKILNSKCFIPAACFIFCVYVAVFCRVVIFIILSTPTAQKMLNDINAQYLVALIKMQDLVFTEQEVGDRDSAMHILTEELSRTDWATVIDQVQNSQSLCHGHLTHFNETFLIRTALVNRTSAMGLVNTRLKDDPLRVGQLKYVTVMCDTYEDYKNDNAPIAKKYFDICSPNTMDIRKNKSIFIEKFTVAVRRYDSYKNDATVRSVLRALFLTRFLEKEPKDTNILFLDDLPLKGVEIFWGMFGYYNTVNNLSDSTIFNYLLLIT